MDWLTGGKQGEAKRLIAHLADVAKRDSESQELIGLGADAVPALIEALQTKDLGLLPIYEQILARIPSASPELIKLLVSAHPIIRARAANGSHRIYYRSVEYINHFIKGDLKCITLRLFCVCCMWLAALSGLAAQ